MPLLSLSLVALWECITLFFLSKDDFFLIQELWNCSKVRSNWSQSCHIAWYLFKATLWNAQQGLLYFSHITIHTPLVHSTEVSNKKQFFNTSATSVRIDYLFYGWGTRQTKNWCLKARKLPFLVMGKEESAC